jgi:hypothetical protein
LVVFANRVDDRCGQLKPRLLLDTVAAMLYTHSVAMG